MQDYIIQITTDGSTGTIKTAAPTPSLSATTVRYGDHDRGRLMHDLQDQTINHKSIENPEGTPQYICSITYTNRCHSTVLQRNEEHESNDCKCFLHTTKSMKLISLYHTINNLSSYKQLHPAFSGNS